MRATTLLYHDIVLNRDYDTSGFMSADANIYKLDSAEFQRHLVQIAVRAGAPPTTVLEGADDSAGTKLLLTFDDGGAGAALASKMLGEYGWHAHFFITTDYIDSPGFLSQFQIRELKRKGHIIGSHSCTHPARMSHCPSPQLEREWRDSVRRLEDILSSRVDVASVPSGYYDRRVAVAAANAGIRFLFTSEPTVRSHEVGGCTVIGRFSVQQGTPAEWVGAVAGGAVAPRLQRWLFWNAKKLLKAAGGSVWLKMRRKVLAQRARSARAK